MRRILDAVAKEQVAMILAFGGTRESAAHYLKCHPRTIYNETKRDPEFAMKLDAAYANAELGLVQTLFNSAAKGTANSAKWLLERLNPDKFGKRKPGAFTLAMIQSMFGKLADKFIEHAPSDSHRDFALQMLTDFGREQAAATQPFLEDCLPLAKKSADVEEARKRREEYAKFDAEEEIAYQEYEAEQAAKKKERAEAKERAVREQQAAAQHETASAAATVAAAENATKSVTARTRDVQEKAQSQAAATVKKPKLSKSARRKQYEAAKRAAAAAAQPTPPLKPDPPETTPLKPLSGGLDSAQL